MPRSPALRACGAEIGSMRSGGRRSQSAGPSKLSTPRRRPRRIGARRLLQPRVGGRRPDLNDCASLHSAVAFLRAPRCYGSMCRLALMSKRCGACVAGSGSIGRPRTVNFDPKRSFPSLWSSRGGIPYPFLRAAAGPKSRHDATQHVGRRTSSSQTAEFVMGQNAIWSPAVALWMKRCSRACHRSGRTEFTCTGKLRRTPVIAASRGQRTPVHCEAGLRIAGRCSLFTMYGAPLKTRGDVSVDVGEIMRPAGSHRNAQRHGETDRQVIGELRTENALGRR